MEAVNSTHAHEASSSSQSDAVVDSLFDALWGRVLENWDDENTHKALLEYALRSQQLAQAAGRYRALKDDPDKGELASERIDAIVIAATQMMLSMKTPPREKIPTSISLSALAFVAMVILMIFYAFNR